MISHRYRDEVKRHKLIGEKRIEIISSAKNLAKSILKEPSLWNHQTFHAVRGFVETAQNKP